MYLHSFMSYLAAYGDLRVYFVESRMTDKFSKHYVSIVVLGFGIGVAVLLGLFWDRLTTIQGQPTSYVTPVYPRIHNRLSLLLISVVAGGVGSISMVTLFPFASAHGVKMISALSAGSGSSALFASILALIQGINFGETINFGPSTYFYIISGLCSLSFIALLSILLSPAAKKLRVEATGINVSCIRDGRAHSLVNGSKFVGG